MPIENNDITIKFEDGTILWRYMSFSKFESLLKNKALFFCRADKFSDPFEGSVPKKEADYRFSEDRFKTNEHIFKRIGREYNETNEKEQSNEIADLHKRIKIATTVNCWHINNHESDAMWQLYLKDNEGIAIKTTKTNLYKALEPTEQKVGISKVRYINYATDHWYHKVEFPFESYNIISPIIHKRIEFKHESELRLYCYDPNREKIDYWDEQPNNIGEFIPVDINILIEAIVFHPTADQKVKDKIIKMTKGYGYNFIFQESKMSIDPTY